MDAKQVNRITLAWKKWADKAVGQAEKDGIKETIQKLLDKNGWAIDWKNGKVTLKQAKQAAPPKQATTGGWSTKDLAAYISKATGKEWTPKMLRRYLRQMDAYNDGRMTHYEWSGQGDPMVAKVLEFVKAKKSA